MNGPHIRMIALLGLIIATIFAMDLVLPLGVAAGVPYVLAILVSLRVPGARVTVVVAITATVLIITGYFVSTPAGVQWMVLANRAMAIAVVWISAYLLIGRKHIIKELREAGNRLETVFETVPDAIIVINDTGHIESFNQAAEKLFGYTSDEVLGRNVSMLMPEPHNKDHDKYLAQYRATGEKHIIGKGREVLGQKKDGEHFPVRLAVGEMNLGGHHAFTGILHDLTELRNVEKESLEDAPTGMANRRAFDKLLAAALSRDETSLLFIDLDKLKLINDELGHLRGDEAIAMAAQKISGSLRTTDPAACARIGGDEFAVVMPHTGEHVATRLAERIMNATQRALVKIHPQSGVSIGIATAPKDTAPEELLRMADEALYRAKATGGRTSQ